MGDKGKKDKEKSRKQKVVKETESAKKAQEKVAARFSVPKLITSSAMGRPPRR
ncbi:MAG TPA: hypothetical protein VGB09_13215 [Candidatus Binatia bacterium]|jgi:hypothetical protein